MPVPTYLSLHTYTACQAKTGDTSAADSRAQWVDVLVCMEGTEAQQAKRSLLGVVTFLQAARGTQEAEDFFDCLLSIGGMTNAFD